MIVATAADSEMPAPLTAMQPDKSSVLRTIGNGCEGGKGGPEVERVTSPFNHRRARPAVKKGPHGLNRAGGCHQAQLDWPEAPEQPGVGDDQ